MTCTGIETISTELNSSMTCASTTPKGAAMLPSNVLTCDMSSSRWSAKRCSVDSDSSLSRSNPERLLGMVGISKVNQILRRFRFYVARIRADTQKNQHVCTASPPCPRVQVDPSTLGDLQRRSCWWPPATNQRWDRGPTNPTPVSLHVETGYCNAIRQHRLLMPRMHPPHGACGRPAGWQAACSIVQRRHWRNTPPRRVPGRRRVPRPARR